MLHLSSVLLVVSLMFGAIQPGSPAPKRVSRPVRHVVVADLETMRTAREVDRRLRDASGGRVDAFVLELNGDRWRSDVVRHVGASLRASGVRTIVWLRDTRGKTVGAGQAVLGLVATECWIDPGTEVRRREADDAGMLAPKGTNHPRLTQEIMAWAAEGARSRGTDPLALRILIGEAAPMWATRPTTEGAWRLTPSEPEESDTAEPVVRPGDDGGLETRLTAEQVVGLKIASGEAAHVGQMFAWRGVSPNASVGLPIGGNLAAILEGVAGSLEAVDRQIASIEAELGAKPRGERSDTRSFFRELGVRVLKRTEEARRSLGACEKRLEDDPEIVRTPPPGTTRVAGDADRHAAEWRRAFQTRLAHLARLEKKARGYAGK